MRRICAKATGAALCLILLATACAANASRPAAAPRAIPAQTASGTSTTAATTPPVRYVAVSVATLWTAPGMTRAVDHPALTFPADPRRWVAQMTTTQKRWLVGRLETQALYGTKVYVLGTSGAWTKIAVPSQPTPRNAWGYPGWVPTAQLTTHSPAASRYYAIVRSRTAWLYTSTTTVGTTAGRLMEVSYDTRFAVVRASGSTVTVLTLGRSQRGMALRDLLVHRTGTPWTPTRAGAVAESRKMLGLGYLWAGTSGFGYDCSGLTYSIFHEIGVQLRRDAGDQARYGVPVAKSALLPGDLVFFRNSAGSIVHVAMVYGTINGIRYVIESPATGLAVRLTPLSHWTWQYAGARRYLTR